MLDLDLERKEVVNMTKQKVAPFYANCVDCAQEGVRTETNLTWVGTFLCELHILDRAWGRA